MKPSFAVVSLLVGALVACAASRPPEPPAMPVLPAAAEPARPNDEIAPVATVEEDDPEVLLARIVNRIPIGTSPTRGPADALVTIVELSDFQCPYCKRAEKTLARVFETYGDRVRLVWKDMPLSSHPHAEPAAELARSARAQRGEAGFWTTHDLLFASQASLEDADLERIAGAAKLDVAKATSAMRTHAYRREIDEDLDLGDDFDANGAPHFFVNGRRIVGAKSFETFQPIIDEEIAKAQALLAAGTPRAAVYDTLVKDGKTPPPPAKKTISAPSAPAPFRGAAGAKVVIQEVGDFQCPFCRRGDASMEELLAAYPGKIKVVWRDKPLAMHADAPLAAEAAREAFAQKGNEGFARMQKLLFENQRALERSDLDGYARKVGLDAARFAKALDGRIHRAAVEADAVQSDDAGVNGTPAFFVGPYFVSGASTFRRLRRLVDRALDEAPPQTTVDLAAKNRIR